MVRGMDAAHLGPRPAPHLISFDRACFAPGPDRVTFIVYAYRKPHGLLGGGRTFTSREAAERFEAERAALGLDVFGVREQREPTSIRVRWSL